MTEYDSCAGGVGLCEDALVYDEEQEQQDFMSVFVWQPAAAQRKRAHAASRTGSGTMFMATRSLRRRSVN